MPKSLGIPTRNDTLPLITADLYASMNQELIADGLESVMKAPARFSLVARYERHNLK